MIWFEDEKPRRPRRPGEEPRKDPGTAPRDRSLPVDRAKDPPPAPERPRPRDERPPGGKT